MLADNEQQRFQGLKRRALEKGANERTIEENAVVERGFVTGGLWSWSRHPVSWSRSRLLRRCGEGELQHFSTPLTDNAFSNWSH